MTREQITGFLIGIGLGTVLGFFLRNEKENERAGSAGVREHRSGGPPANGAAARKQTGIPATPYAV